MVKGDDQTKRLRWIYLTDYKTGEVGGLRCWYAEHRCDLHPKDGKWEYWISECFESGHDVYWTRSRFSDDIFAAMVDGEKWIREIGDAYLESDPDRDDE